MNVRITTARQSSTAVIALARVGAPPAKSEVSIAAAIVPIKVAVDPAPKNAGNAAPNTPAAIVATD
jgi:hypothetical protein